MDSDDIQKTHIGDKKLRKLTTHDVDDVRAYIAKLPPKKRQSCRHAIKQLLPDIEYAKQLGYTDRDICDIFHELRIDMSISSLRSYVRQERAHGRRDRGSKGASKKRRATRHKPSDEAGNARTTPTTGRFAVTPDEEV